MNMEMLNGHTGLVESYMSNGLRTLLLILTRQCLGLCVNKKMHLIQL